MGSLPFPHCKKGRRHLPAAFFYPSPPTLRAFSDCALMRTFQESNSKLATYENRRKLINYINTNKFITDM